MWGVSPVGAHKFECFCYLSHTRENALICNLIFFTVVIGLTVVLSTKRGRCRKR